MIDRMLIECPEGWYLGRSKTKGKIAWNKRKPSSKEAIEKFKKSVKGCLRHPFLFLILKAYLQYSHR